MSVSPITGHAGTITSNKYDQIVHQHPQLGCGRQGQSEHHGPLEIRPQNPTPENQILQICRGGKSSAASLAAPTQQHILLFTSIPRLANKNEHTQINQTHEYSWSPSSTGKLSDKQMDINVSLCGPTIASLGGLPIGPGGSAEEAMGCKFTNEHL